MGWTIAASARDVSPPPPAAGGGVGRIDSARSKMRLIFFASLVPATRLPALTMWAVATQPSPIGRTSIFQRDPQDQPLTLVSKAMVSRA